MAATQFETYICIRCGETRDEPFTWAHVPNANSQNAGYRTCGGKVVPASQVEAAREEAERQFTTAVIGLMRAESGWAP